MCRWLRAHLIAGSLWCVVTIVEGSPYCRLSLVCRYNCSYIVQTLSCLPLLPMAISVVEGSPYYRIPLKRRYIMQTLPGLPTCCHCVITGSPVVAFCRLSLVCHCYLVCWMFYVILRKLRHSRGLYFALGYGG